MTSYRRCITAVRRLRSCEFILLAVYIHPAAVRESTLSFFPFKAPRHAEAAITNLEARPSRAEFPTLADLFTRFFTVPCNNRGPRGVDYAQQYLWEIGKIDNKMKLERA